jgi:hypothetical protein
MAQSTVLKDNVYWGKQSLGTYLVIVYKTLNAFFLSQMILGI